MKITAAFRLLLLVLAVAILPAMAVAQAAGPSVAPPAAAEAFDPSGSYTFLQDGELLQIYLEPDGKLAGIVSRYADKGGFIDHYINSGSLQGSRLTFGTQVIHGTSFSFRGEAMRGKAKATSDEGYYLLRGTLREEASSGGKTVAREREVEFKSLPLDLP